MKNLIQLAAGAALLLCGATLALAQSDTATSSASVLSKISYPVAELGNCDSRDACKTYCDADANHDACFAYAQKVGLMSREKIEAAKIILAKGGPGLCNSKESCVAYCSDSSHQDECLSFAQTHKVIASSTVMLIKKLNSGEGPGACKSSATCKMYCEDSSHRDECRAFAEENGLARPMGSSTMMKPPRTGSSTVEQVKQVLASTTPGRERGMELHDIHGSTTPPGIQKGEPQRKVSSTTPPGFQKPGIGSSTEGRPLPPKPVQPSGDDSLGASVLRGFARLLGF